jgi:hypothetical protein
MQGGDNKRKSKPIIYKVIWDAEKQREVKRKLPK